ncbi:hypothetical protein K6119_17795 [Paracrocinitomix mangrovi]|uniref:hypothetical protein n=1 Tax=Paracrocinitomix mangrovi TaxID=2862509 RepID=UPI001C8D31EA|nr:hypothetical protein [Paracrocinitomix mangrovi]UKN01580.1 hypothetical protein K6119_17795 [Paracrocinitomix mangrovi]
MKLLNTKTLVVAGALTLGSIGLSSFISSDNEMESKGNPACEVYGKIKIVDYGEDYKVKKVDYGEDVKIKWVDYGEDNKGKWKEVDYGEDHKIKWVDYGEDFKIKIVDYGEGC